MSREILFRGKATKGKWVYGYPNIYDDESINFVVGKLLNSLLPMEDCCVNIEYDTLGQYTGLTDKNGKKIFEGDILRLCNATYPILVYWDCLGWKFLRNGKRVQGAFECDIKHDIEICEVIGNIFDNPEILQEK